MDWISSHIMEILTFALVIITGVYAVLTGRYVRLTNRLLKATTDTPKIAIYLTSEEAGRAMLCVENIGTGLAYDVQFKADFSLKRYSSDNPATLEDVGFLRDGIKYLPPKVKRECAIHLSGRLDELKETRLRISVTYKDSEKKEYPDCFCLNFGEVIGR